MNSKRIIASFDVEFGSISEKSLKALGFPEITKLPENIYSLIDLDIEADKEARKLLVDHGLIVFASEFPDRPNCVVIRRLPTQFLKDIKKIPHVKDAFDVEIGYSLPSAPLEVR